MQHWKTTVVGYIPLVIAIVAAVVDFANTGAVQFDRETLGWLGLVLVVCKAIESSLAADKDKVVTKDELNEIVERFRK